jgi:hypothetical protein
MYMYMYIPNVMATIHVRLSLNFHDIHVHVLCVYTLILNFILSRGTLPTMHTQCHVCFQNLDTLYMYIPVKHPSF